MVFFKSITERIKGSIKKKEKEKFIQLAAYGRLLHLICEHLISKLIILCLLSNVCLKGIGNVIQVTFTGSPQLKREAQHCQETL